METRARQLGHMTARMVCGFICVLLMSRFMFYCGFTCVLFMMSFRCVYDSLVFAFMLRLRCFMLVLYETLVYVRLLASDLVPIDEALWV